ncbi:RICIN domain-containing protein [Candidatus Saccharibacteria bacterium]|nr:RICIN domain-containing protein [Candidatus Saccharibacteria bacterium]
MKRRKTTKKQAVLKKKQPVIKKNWLIAAGVAIFVALGLLTLHLANAAANKTGAIRHSSGRCLDNSFSRVVNGNNFHLWDCNGSAAQKVTMKSVGNSSYNLVVQGRCVEGYVPNATEKDNLSVKLRTCDNRTSMKWKKGTNGSLVNQRTKFCLVPKFGGTKNGTLLVVSYCNKSNSQKWSTP